MPETLQFKKWLCKPEMAKYQGGNPAMRLIGVDLPEYDHLVAVASVNLPGLAIDEIAIKDYSENEGMYKTLLDAGLILPAHRFQDSGYIENIPICYLITNETKIKCKKQ